MPFETFPKTLPKPLRSKLLVYLSNYIGPESSQSLAAFSPVEPYYSVPLMLYLQFYSPVAMSEPPTL